MRTESFAAASLMVAVAVLGGCMGMGSNPSAGPSQPPEAAFTLEPSSPMPGQPVQFQDVSTGSVRDRLWEFGDGEIAREKAPVHTYAIADVYLVRLTVRSPDGVIDTAERYVGVGVQAPGADGAIQVRIGTDVKGLVVAFDAQVTPEDTFVASYFWDFGDQAVSREANPIHSYARPGTYGVVLRVSVEGSIWEARTSLVVGSFATHGTLADRSFAVVALVDTGINPYHEEFRDAAFTTHPSTYVQGYPEGAQALDVSLSASQFSRALDQDRDVWSGVKSGQLYWIPGTRIVGAVSIAQDGPHRILDDDGHGTAVASIAAGATLGACPECLIVVVEGLGEAPLRWAMAQPWIDIVSNSWISTLCDPFLCPANLGLLPPPASLYGIDTDASRKAVEEGRVVLFASGNGWFNAFDVPQVSYVNAYTGPDWIVTVGAAEANSGATVVGTGRPVDIVSYGLNWRGASHTSMTAFRTFGGTSSATPLAAGVFGHVLQEARATLGDTREGPRGQGVVAQGEAPQELPATSWLRDGKLTRAELERAVFLTARGADGTGPVVPATLPDSAAAFLYAGYGLVDEKSRDRALDVVLGRAQPPVRDLEDRWAGIDSAIRVALWGSWNPGGERGQDVPDWSQTLTLDDVAEWEAMLEVWAAAYAASEGSV